MKKCRKLFSRAVTLAMLVSSTAYLWAAYIDGDADSAGGGWSVGYDLNYLGSGLGRTFASKDNLGSAYVNHYNCAWSTTLSPYHDHFTAGPMSSDMDGKNWNPSDWDWQARTLMEVVGSEASNWAHAIIWHEI